MIIAHSNKYCLSLLANPTLSTAMSEKEKEAQVSENETKGENFFFKHERTKVCQKGGATEILEGVSKISRLTYCHFTTISRLEMVVKRRLVSLLTFETPSTY